MTPRRSAAGLLAVAAGLLVLHGLQALLGHRLFVIGGPLAAGTMSVAVAALGLRSRVPRSTAVRVGCALFVLLVVPEWLEGELALGHDVDLFGHALPTAVAIGVALLAVVTVEALRTLRLLRDGFS
jgi:hypothetical protein